MANLNEIDVAEDADEYERWAAEREFELRHGAYEIAKAGALGAFRRLNAALEGLRVAIGGLDAHPARCPCYACFQKRARTA